MKRGAPKPGTLGELANIPAARTIVIHDVWSGMNDDSPISSVYELRRDERNALSGDARFSRRGQLRQTRRVELDAVQSTRFLELIADAEAVDGAYQPLLHHTDDFPDLEIAIHVGEDSPPSGIVLLFSSSQGDFHAPWGACIRGELFTIPSAGIGRALRMLPKSPDDEERRSPEDAATAPRLLLMMVVELHHRGFEGLRIAPYLSPSGMHWRCQFVPMACTKASNGAMASSAADELFDGAHYSSSSGFEFFDWGDCSSSDPSQMADRFQGSFGRLLVQCREPDADYVAWFRTMLQMTEPFGLVYAFADYEIPEGVLSVEGDCPVREVPLPPPGESAMQRKGRAT